jgi:hypothetical protein
MRVKLQRVRRRCETSPEGYDLYLRPRPSDFRQSIGAFEEAISKDPFALGYNGLTATYALPKKAIALDP